MSDVPVQEVPQSIKDRIRRVTKYKISDGREFDTVDEAVEQQFRLDVRDRLRQYVDRTTVEYFSTDINDVSLDIDNVTDYIIDNISNILNVMDIKVVKK